MLAENAGQMALIRKAALQGDDLERAVGFSQELGCTLRSQAQEHIAEVAAEVLPEHPREVRARHAGFLGNLVAGQLFAAAFADDAHRVLKHRGMRVARGRVDGIHDALEHFVEPGRQFLVVVDRGEARDRVVAAAQQLLGHAAAFDGCAGHGDDQLHEQTFDQLEAVASVVNHRHEEAVEDVAGFVAIALADGRHQRRFVQEVGGSQLEEGIGFVGVDGLGAGLFAAVGLAAELEQGGVGEIVLLGQAAQVGACSPHVDDGRG